MTESSEKLEKNQAHGKPWYKHLATLSFGAMIISIASAGVSGYLASQANGVAQQQEVVSERQELVTLITNIAQEPANISQESVTFHENTVAFQNAEVGTQLTELAESEEAANLIGLLHDNGVTAVEYYYTAFGLQNGESDAQALSLLEKATTLQADPRTRANILRAEAVILYQFGKDSKAEHDMILAEQAFNGPDVTNDEKSSNMALTELVDAQYQAGISCQKAQAEVSSATNILKENPDEKTPQMASQEVTDESLAKPPEVTGGPGNATKPQSMGEQVASGGAGGSSASPASAGSGSAGSNSTAGSCP